MDTVICHPHFLVAKSNSLLDCVAFFPSFAGLTGVHHSNTCLEPSSGNDVGLKGFLPFPGTVTAPLTQLVRL